MLNLKVVSWALAVTASVSYVLCVSYGLIAPDSLRMHAFLAQVLPGFEWLTLPGFLTGLIESFLYGAYLGLVYVPAYNFFSLRWGDARAAVASPPDGRKSMNAFRGD